MIIKIRKAKPEDLPILLDFEQQLIAVERPMDISLEQTKKIHYYDIRSYITSEKAQLYVATIEDEIIASGYGLIKKNDPKFAYREHGYIGFIFVKEIFRGQGISKLIFNAIFDWFRAKKIKEVKLTVYEENPSAIRAYKKLGFKKNLIEMLYYLE